MNSGFIYTCRTCGARQGEKCPEEEEKEKQKEMADEMLKNMQEYYGFLRDAILRQEEDSYNKELKKQFVWILRS
jgi:hypothetical protein